MNDQTLRALLDLLMCSDPWPVVPENGSQRLLIAYADDEARKRGFTDWVGAYHRLAVP